MIYNSIEITKPPFFLPLYRKSHILAAVVCFKAGSMGALLHSFSVAFITPKALKLVHGNGSSRNQISSLEFANGYSSFSSRRPVTSQKLSVGRRKSVIVGAKKNNNKEKKKNDNHSFVSKPDEATGPFPEAVLLKEVVF